MAEGGGEHFAEQKVSLSQKNVGSIFLLLTCHFQMLAF